jgi:hypothetical protein
LTFKAVLDHILKEDKSAANRKKGSVVPDTVENGEATYDISAKATAKGSHAEAGTAYIANGQVTFPHDHENIEVELGSLEIEDVPAAIAAICRYAFRRGAYLTQLDNARDERGKEAGVVTKTQTTGYKAVLAAKLSSGEITQEQHDEFLALVE